SFESVQAYVEGQMRLATKGEPLTVESRAIESDFPHFAGAAPIAGRMFTPAEALDKAHVALLGEGIWRTRFGAGSSVIGQRITLDDASYSVIGVLPSRLDTPRIGGAPADVWLPIDLRNDSSAARVVGRLNPGATEAGAQRELDSLAARSSNAELRL